MGDAAWWEDKGMCDAYKSILSFLDTLEVKEMNLEKELDYRDYMEFFKQHPTYNDGNWGFDECWVFAKHFFKLGLKASYKENI
jgi:hypothetical protein